MLLIRPGPKPGAKRTNREDRGMLSHSADRDFYLQRLHRHHRQHNAVQQGLLPPAALNSVATDDGNDYAALHRLPGKMPLDRWLGPADDPDHNAVDDPEQRTRLREEPQ